MTIPNIRATTKNGVLGSRRDGLYIVHEGAAAIFFYGHVSAFLQPDLAPQTEFRQNDAGREHANGQQTQEPGGPNVAAVGLRWPSLATAVVPVALGRRLVRVVIGKIDDGVSDGSAAAAVAAAFVHVRDVHGRVERAQEQVEHHDGADEYQAEQVAGQERAEDQHRSETFDVDRKSKKKTWVAIDSAVGVSMATVGKNTDNREFFYFLLSMEKNEKLSSQMPVIIPGICLTRFDYIIFLPGGSITVFVWANLMFKKP